MRTRTSAALIAVLAALLIRTAMTGSYLQYVAGWMRWPLVATGAVLMVLAISALFSPDSHEHRQPAGHPDHTDDGANMDGAAHVPGQGPGQGHGHHIPRVAWLLLLPVVAAYAVSPPAVGAFLAERRAGEVVSPGPDAYGDLPDVEVVGLDVREYVWRVQDRDPQLPGRAVSLTGFVSPTSDGQGWYLTRVAINCCAADAIPYRILVTGVPAPPTDSWVRVTGTFDVTTWAGPPQDAVITPDTVEPVAKPEHPYL